MVWSVALYEAESWTILKADRKKQKLSKLGVGEGR